MKVWCSKRRQKWMVLLAFAMSLCFAMTEVTYADEQNNEEVIDTSVEVGISEAEDRIVKIDSSNFPQLYKTLRGFAYDVNQDGYFSGKEIEELKVLAVSDRVSDLKGLEYLTSLNKLFLVNYNGSKLKLDQSVKQIETLCVTPSKETFTVDAPFVKNLGIGQVECFDDSIMNHAVLNVRLDNGAHVNHATRKVVLTNCTGVEKLIVRMGWMNSITMPKSGSQLKHLDIDGSRLQTLDLKNAAKLETIELSTSEFLKALDLSKNTKLSNLTIGNLLGLKTVNVSKCTGLKYAYISWDIGVRKIDFSKCKNIKKVFRPNDEVSVVMPAGKKSLLTGYGWDAKDKDDYDVYQKSRMGYDSWHYAFVSRHSEYEDDYNKKGIVKLTKANFPDIYDSISYLDFDANGWLSQSELDALTAIYCDASVRSLKGIEYFRFLNTIKLSKYSGSKITISSKNKALRRLSVKCDAKELTVNGKDLVSLNISMTNKNATKVNASACKNLSAFSLSGADPNENNVKLKSVALPKSGKKLKYLELSSLGISSVNFSDYANLEGLGLFYNRKLKSVSVTKNTKLRGVWVISSEMGTLDLSRCTKLEEYFCLYNNCILPKKNLAKRKTNYWMYGIYHSIDGYWI